MMNISVPRLSMPCAPMNSTQYLSALPTPVRVAVCRTSLLYHLFSRYLEITPTNVATSAFVFLGKLGHATQWHELFLLHREMMKCLVDCNRVYRMEYCD